MPYKPTEETVTHRVLESLNYAAVYVQLHLTESDTLKQNAVWQMEVKSVCLLA